MLEKISIQLKHPICKCMITDGTPEYGCNIGITPTGPFLEITCLQCGSFYVIRGKELSVYWNIGNIPEEQDSTLPLEAEEQVKKKSSVKIPDNWKVIK